MPPLPQRPLPQGYYADNFALVLTTVRERYEDLLRDDELAFHDGFEALSVDARRLYVRLISRRGPVFRRDRLEYQEIASIEAAIGELEVAGFADRGESAPPPDLLRLLLRLELAAAVELAPGTVKASARKAEIVDALLENADCEPLRRAVAARIEVVAPLHREHVLTFRLLFFGNLSQDLTEFVLRDIGVVRYETYGLGRDLRLFPDRAALDDSLHLRQLKTRVGRSLAAGEVAQGVELARGVLERIDRWHPSTRPLADRILGAVGRVLERRGDLREALAFYAAALAPPARERRARVMARLGRLAEALALCEEIGGDPRDETEVVFARRFAHRLRRMRGEPLAPRPRRRRPTKVTNVAPRQGVAVEQLALEALAAAGCPGFFAENWLWKSLFGLAFWDAVFAPVAGAFQHPFQYGPRDLHSPAFRTLRAEMIGRRLAELRAEPRPGVRLLEVYEAKKDVANPFVAWDEGRRPDLELALSRLEGRHLAWVCDRLSRDPGRYRRGFPDLFVLRAAAPGFELYEVKAPGDQLRPEQASWIDYFNDGGIPASILEIRWQV